MTRLNVALIAGDGIGVEVTDAAWEVAEAAAACDGLALSSVRYPWSCEYYLETGAMMPDDGIEALRQHDAIFLGAVGWPEKVPDSISLHGLLLPIRKSFVQYANMRPHRLLPGVRGPLKQEEFDILCIRENTEGEYAGAGGRVHSGLENEVAVETSVFTRKAVERIVRFAFEKARARRGKLSSVTKSNAQRYTMAFWDDVTRELASDYPDVEMTCVHVDAMAAQMVMAPERLDVVVASNLFGDILTDIGAAIQGGLGLAASANVNPAGDFPSMFEPVHGSAPDIAAQGIANPLAAIWSAAIMFDHLGAGSTADRIMRAVEAVTRQGIGTCPGADKTIAISGAVLREIERTANDQWRKCRPEL